MRAFVTSAFILCIIIAANSVASCNLPKAAAKSYTTRQSSNTSGYTGGQRQRRPNLYPIILQKYFTRVWGGFEWCNTDTGKTAAVITLSSKDSTDVYVNGLYDKNTQVKAAIRGYMVIIEPQKIHLASGEHTVEGTFILLNDFNSLTGFYKTKTGVQTDSCRATFHPVQQTQR